MRARLLLELGYGEDNKNKSTDNFIKGDLFKSNLIAYAILFNNLRIKKICCDLYISNCYI